MGQPSGGGISVRANPAFKEEAATAGNGHRNTAAIPAATMKRARNLFRSWRDSHIDIGLAQGFCALNSMAFALAFCFGLHAARNRLAVGSLLTGVLGESIDLGFD